jgi:hypothetical protein
MALDFDYVGLRRRLHSLLPSSLPHCSRSCLLTYASILPRPSFCSLAGIDRQLNQTIAKLRRAVRACDSDAGKLQLVTRVTQLLTVNRDWNTPKIWSLAFLIYDELKQTEATQALSGFPAGIRALAALLQRRDCVLDVTCAQYPKCDVYVVDEYVGYASCCETKSGSAGQFLFRPSLDGTRGEYFTASTVKWPAVSLYVANTWIAEFMCRSRDGYDHVSPQGRISITPVNEGQYFTMSCAQWPSLLIATR